ncbi:MAG TPA: hypothetical protein VFH68_19405 [Polyangia bacterium]|jgi:hypothetical protein|nr:hypothetical protein [Polyangia bacterium]
MSAPSARATTFLSLMLLAVGWLPGGCGQPPAIGNACVVGSPGGGQEVTISTPALECESRICLQVGGGEPLCTGACGSDDDCLNLSPTAGQLCPAGFVCRAASPFGDHPCQRLCVCRAAQPPEAVCSVTP